MEGDSPLLRIIYYFVDKQFFWKSTLRIWESWKKQNFHIYIWFYIFVVKFFTNFETESP